MKKKQNHFKQHNGKMPFPQNSLPHFSSFKSFLKPNEIIFWGSRNGKLSLNNELYISIIYVYYMPYMYMCEHINIIWWVLSILGLHPLNCWSKYLLKIINPTHLFWQCHYSTANTEKQAFEECWNCMTYREESMQPRYLHTLGSRCPPEISRQYHNTHWDIIMELPESLEFSKYKVICDQLNNVTQRH